MPKVKRPDLIGFYRSALRKAWEDGRITHDERSILLEFQPSIGSDQVDKIEAREYFRNRWKEYSTSPDAYKLKILESALEFDPENDHLWSQKAIVLFNIGDLDSALSSADKALDLCSGSMEAWFWKGSILIRLGRYDDAVDCFEEVLEIDPDHTLGWLMLGWSERSRGAHDKAKACYSRVIELCPKLALGYVERGISFIRTGDLESAQIDLLSALDIEPENERAKNILRSMGADLPEEAVEEEVPEEEPEEAEEEPEEAEEEVPEEEPEEAVEEEVPE
ncbi:MAG: tetratricopeptide repeat protein, partial [Candidatus Thermoplasmatota archaeon]|nr:tetratricopeptide repeat protein [Candidatus Thermoplasmatota archaeon]